jgi:hypothetical protein
VSLLASTVHSFACRYDVYLFSKPDTLIAWASLPVVKVMQIRYVLDSIKKLKGAVAQA